MIRNETFTPATVTERNALIDEIEKKTMVIYIEGDLCKELSQEINNQIEKHKSVGSFLKTIAVFAGVAGALMIPGPGWTIAGIALASVLGISGTIVSSSEGEILKQYSLAYDEKENINRFILVRNEFSFEHHSISDDSILTDNKKCPKCGKSYNKKEMFCSNCNKHIIEISNKKALKKMK